MVQFDSQHKTIVESLSNTERKHYVIFLLKEIYRHLHEVGCAESQMQHNPFERVWWESSTIRHEEDIQQAIEKVKQILRKSQEAN